jgi:hypothetical protein
VDEVEQLAVGRAQRVGRREPAAEARRDVDDHALGEDLAGVEDRLHQPRERHALHELDGEVRAHRVRPPALDLDDVGVREGRGHPHLVLKLILEAGILGDVGVQPLDGEQVALEIRPSRVGGAAEIDPRGGACRDLGEHLERDRPRRGIG